MGSGSGLLIHITVHENSGGTDRHDGETDRQQHTNTLSELKGLEVALMLASTSTFSGTPQACPHPELRVESA